MQQSGLVFGSKNWHREWIGTAEKRSKTVRCRVVVAGVIFSGARNAGRSRDSAQIDCADDKKAVRNHSNISKQPLEFQKVVPIRLGLCSRGKGKCSAGVKLCWGKPAAMTAEALCAWIGKSWEVFFNFLSCQKRWNSLEE